MTEVEHNHEVTTPATVPARRSNRPVAKFVWVGLTLVTVGALPVVYFVRSQAEAQAQLLDSRWQERLVQQPLGSQPPALQVNQGGNSPLTSFPVANPPTPQSIITVGQPSSLDYSKIIQAIKNEPENSDKKNDLIANLSRILSDEFDANHVERLEQLTALEKRVSAARATLSKRLELKSQIVERRMNELLGQQDPMNWDGPALPKAESGVGLGSTKLPPKSMSMPSGGSSQLPQWATTSDILGTYESIIDTERLAGATPALTPGPNTPWLGTGPSHSRTEPSTVANVNNLSRSANPVSRSSRMERESVVSNPIAQEVEAVHRLIDSVLENRVAIQDFLDTTQFVPNSDEVTKLRRESLRIIAQAENLERRESTALERIALVSEDAEEELRFASQALERIERLVSGNAVSKLELSTANFEVRRAERNEQSVKLYESEYRAALSNLKQQVSELKKLLEDFKKKAITNAQAMTY